MSWVEHQIASFEDLDISALSVDESYLKIFCETNLKLWLYELSSNCHTCAYTLVTWGEKGTLDCVNNNLTLIVNTKYTMKYRLRLSPFPVKVAEYPDEKKFCDLKYHFGEFGVYGWRALNEECESISVSLEPVNIYLPLLLNIIIYGLVWAIFLIASKHWNRITSVLPSLFKSKRNRERKDTIVEPAVNFRVRQEWDTFSLQMNSGTGPSEDWFTPKRRKRLRSLDTFRGLAVVLMVFATYGGGGYYFFADGAWDGLYLTEMAFPWMLWIMGVCIPLSLQFNLEQGITKAKIFKKISIRSVKLFLSGFIVVAIWEITDLTMLRLLGVLQRYAVCYFVCAILILFAMDGDITNIWKPCAGKYKMLYRDVAVGWGPWIIVCSLALMHVLLTKLLPVPGCPTGYLGPAGLADGGQYPAFCAGGAAGFIDRKLITENHLYKSQTAKDVYKTGDLDPEGLLGNLTAILQTWLGVQTGMTLLTHKKAAGRLSRFILWALLLGVAGAALCECKWTGGFIPINKSLWSLSYVLVSSSFAQFMFTLFYYVVDVQRWWLGYPLFESGQNSLFIYFGHYMTIYYFPWSWKIGTMNTHFKQMFECLWGVSVWVIIGIWLRHKKFMWKF